MLENMSYEVCAMLPLYIHKYIYNIHIFKMRWKIVCEESWNTCVLGTCLIAKVIHTRTHSHHVLKIPFFTFDCKNFKALTNGRKRILYTSFPLQSMQLLIHTLSFHRVWIWQYPTRYQHACTMNDVSFISCIAQRYIRTCGVFSYTLSSTQTQKQQIRKNRVTHKQKISKTMALWFVLCWC